MDQDYAKMTDEELAVFARNGDEDAEEYLIKKYKEVARGKAHSYYILGGDTEDVVQEGMIGVFKAIRSYDESKNTLFRTFAELCINRQIITAIKAAGRRKHSPLNSSVSLSGIAPGSDTDSTLAETLAAEGEADPETKLVHKEILNYIVHNEGGVFSEFELYVWNERMKGKTYIQIANESGKSSKAVANAIQRTKKKIITYMQE